jgi:hypothetical protein
MEGDAKPLHHHKRPSASPIQSEDQLRRLTYLILVLFVPLSA